MEKRSLKINLINIVSSLFIFISLFFCSYGLIKATNKKEVVIVADDNRNQLIKEKLDMVKAFEGKGEQRRMEEVDRFLKIIEMLESSGGKTFEHRRIPSGIHKGHRAVGRYGLMPNTVQETLQSMRNRGELTEQLEPYVGLEPEELKSTLEKDTESERALARDLAKKVMKRQDMNPEKSAYSWLYGHNLSPEQIESRNYEDEEYVKRYNKFKKRLFNGK